MLLNTLFLALRSIRRNLLRSFLTILGIVIGVDRLLDMCRTTVNVWGDMGAARIMTRIAPD